MQKLLDIMTIRGDDDIGAFQQIWNNLEDYRVVIEASEEIAIDDIDPTMKPRLDTSYESLKNVLERVLTIAEGISLRVYDTSGNDALEGVEALRCRFARLEDMISVPYTEDASGVDIAAMIVDIDATNAMLANVIDGLVGVVSFPGRVNAVYESVQRSIQKVQENLLLFPQLTEEFNMLLADWNTLLCFLDSTKDITVEDIDDVIVPIMQSEDLYDQSP